MLVTGYGFQKALGYNNIKVKRIFLNFTMTLPSLFTAEKKSGNTAVSLRRMKCEKLNNTKVSVADEILSKCNELKYSVIAIDDEHYPQKN